MYTPRSRIHKLASDLWNKMRTEAYAGNIGADKELLLVALSLLIHVESRVAMAYGGDYVDEAYMSYDFMEYADEDTDIEKLWNGPSSTNKKRDIING